MRHRVELLLAISVVFAGCGNETAPLSQVGALVDTIDYRTTKGATIQVAEAARVSGMKDDLNPRDRLRTMVVLPDDGVAVYDAGAVRVLYYGPNADPRGTFGRRGGAPGEFRMIFAIGLLGDTLWAGDNQLDRVTLISPEKELLRVTTLPRITGQDVGGDLNSKVLLGLHSDAFVGLLPRNTQLFRANLNGEILNLLPELPSNTKPLRIGNATVFPSLFLSLPPVDVSADGQLIAVYEHLLEGNLSPATRVTVVRANGDTAFVRVVRFEGVDLPKAVVDSIVAQSTKSQPAEYVRAYRDALFVPEFYPPVTDLLIAQDGRVWLKLYSPGQQQEYAVLDADGEMLGSVVLPARTSVRAAKGNVVWTLQFNEFDVADIVKYIAEAPRNGR